MPKGRLEAFSDGVIAIVITLLILEVHVPQIQARATNSEALTQLLKLLPATAAYAVSFILCAVWWVSHHSLVHDLDQVDRPVLWLNCAFLLCLTFLPVPTALLGQQPFNPVISCFYGLSCMAAGASFADLRWYIASSSQRLSRSVSQAVARKRAITSLLSPAGYLTAALVALQFPVAADFLFVAIPAFFAVRTGSLSVAGEQPSAT